MSLVCLAGVVLAAGWVTPMTAGDQQAAPLQDSGFWNTSADAPAGLPPALLSAPDRLVPAVDDTANPPSLVLGLTSWRVTGSALKPRENDVSYTVSGSGACTYVTAGDASTVWNTDPGLPDGTVVDTLRMYYNDTNASNSSAWFTVYDLYGAIVQEWSVSTSGSSGNSFSDSAPINHHDQLRRLLASAQLASGVPISTMQLCGFRVFHETPLPVPGVPQALAYTVSGSTVAITWGPPAVDPAPTGYRLEAGSALGASNLAVVPVAGTQYVVTGVPPGIYYVRVRALNGTGLGPATQDVTIVVP
ncbi:MAG: fibronectin type III domain-containing protein [Vicinamibacterales bacterium]